MKRITQEDLRVFLRKHKLWLEDEKDGERANLRGANLRGANLERADLREANLEEANFEGANLERANLEGANLEGANFEGADLERAYLERAYLRGANLEEANLRRANFEEANLEGANLRGAYLRGANLEGAYLEGANLEGAYLRGAYLERANLRGANDLYFPSACPEEGEFIGFKKAQNNLIVKLKITEDAKRCSAAGRKCRCSKATVISITNKDGTDSDLSEVRSKYDNDFVYRIGETVEVKDFCEDRWKECSEGIHFFITREEAVRY